MSAKKKADPVNPVLADVPNNKPEGTTAAVKDFFEHLGNKAPLLALGLILFIGFIVFKDFLLFEKAYTFKDIGSDSYNSSYPFLCHEAEYISKYGIPKWSFSFGMGQSMFPFMFRDPFDIFLYLVGKDHILYGLMYKELAKIVLGGLVFFYYLKMLNRSDYSAIIGSMLFAFCGFNVLGSAWYLFSFESFNIALILLAYERLVAKQNWYLFPIAIFLICLSQPFNLYVYSIFIIIYTLLRHVQTDKFTPKAIGNTVGQMIGLGLIGILLSAPFFIENIFQLLESPRGGGTNSYANLLSGAPMFNVADPMQMGTSIMRFFSSDILGNGTDFKGWTNYLEAPLFYCGLPCLLLMPQVFQFLEKKVKTAFIICITLWLLPIIFPYFRWAFWLFTGDYYRIYSFFVGFFFIYYSLLALDMILAKRKINVIILIATAVILFGLLHYPFFEDSEIVNPMISVFVTIMLICYSALLFFMGKPGSGLYLKYGFFAALVVELLFLSNITVNDRKAITKEDVAARSGYNDYTTEALDYINKNDKSFFRIDKTYASSPAMHFSLNDALAQGYRGTSGYNSFNQQYYIFYLQLMGISNRDLEIESRWAMGLGSRTILETENRVKYMLAKTSINPLWYLVCDSLTTIGDVKIFRNKYVLPVGYTYDHYIKESTFEKLVIQQKDFTTLQAVVIKDDEIAKFPGLTEFQLKDTISGAAFTIPLYAQRIGELKKDSLTITKFDETLLSGNITVNGDKLLYLTIPIDPGWTLRVDGQVTDKLVVDAGMTGVMLKKGPHTIEMKYELRYFSKGLMLTLLGILLYAGLWLYMKKKKPAPQAG